MRGHPGKPHHRRNRHRQLSFQEGATLRERTELSIDTVVFATDFSPCSENAGRYAHLPAQYFVEHIREFNVDLLVIGVRNSSHLDLEMRISDAFHLVVESSCPVLTIRG
jgi:hypothetical protein